MPPRWLTWAIVAFWALTTLWLVLREVAPRWRAGEPPPYTIDLTDEVSGHPIHWIVLGGEKPGKAKSSVHRLADRTFELRTELLCTKLLLFESIKLDNTYQVNNQGELIGVKVKGEIQVLGRQLKGELIGKVQDGYIAPELRGDFLGKEHVFRGEKVKVRGGILNSMALVNKISGLQPGQRWSIPLMDPLKFFSIGIQAPTIPRLDAEVIAGELLWNGDQVPCFIIDYREPGKEKPAARTWVRRSDGIVLQHLANHEVMELVLQRIPSK